MPPDPLEREHVCSAHTSHTMYKYHQYAYKYQAPEARSPPTFVPSTVKYLLSTLRTFNNVCLLYYIYVHIYKLLPYP